MGQRSEGRGRGMPTTVPIASACDQRYFFVKAIGLNPLSPVGYETKHKVLQGMGRSDEAVRTFNDMRSALELSTNPQTQREFVFLSNKTT